MMSLLSFIILVVFGVVSSQNHDVNSKIPYGGRPRRSSVESTTLIPPDPHIENVEMQMLLTRLESLCIEKLEYLISDTNDRFQSLENKLDTLTTEIGRISQCCSVPATPVVQNNEILEGKVENLSQHIQVLIDTTKNMSSNVEVLKKNVSSHINVTRSMEGLLTNLVSKQISNEGLQEIKGLQIVTSTSSPLNSTLDNQYPRNCREVLKSGKTASGTYMIQPERAPKPFEVVCDLETRGGGWTVIQRRFDGSQDFYLGWEDYKIGFGNLGGEFWLGLENIHLLTGFEVNELLIELGDFESQNKSAFYSEFRVGSEIEGYSLQVLGAYSGDAGDSLTYQAAMKFTTKDKDQDADSSIQCAHYHGGAWWYKYCAHSNLNGKYFGRGQVPDTNNYYHTVFWFRFKNHFNSLKHTRMLVRPKV